MLRREGQTEIWQYRTSICVVDYFVYPGTSGKTITGWAWRTPMMNGTLDPTLCRRELAKRELNNP